MPNRSAKSDPQPGDVLRYRDWTIEVLGRDDSTVHYRAKQADDKYWRKNTTQLLIEWQSWTGEAKVSRRGMATLAHLWQPVNASRMKTITQGDPGRLHCRIPEELFIETGIRARARRISITELVV